MIRILTRIALAVAVLFPAVAFAAYNDVTLSTDVVLSINSVSVNVSSASSTIETITVGDTNFTATMRSGSTMIISAPNLSISTEPALGITKTCSSGVLTATIPASDGASITVTPSSTACDAVPASSSSSGGGPIGLIGGGGGGGGSNSYTPTVVTAPTAVTPQTLVSPGAFAKITLALKKGSMGAQVKTLQQMLNQDKDTQVSLSGIGSPGKETTTFGNATLSAIKKFQLKWGIAKAGDAGYGNLGPKTRAKLNELYGK